MSQVVTAPGVEPFVDGHHASLGLRLADAIVQP